MVVTSYYTVWWKETFIICIVNVKSTLDRSHLVMQKFILDDTVVNKTPKTHLHPHIHHYRKQYMHNATLTKKKI